jgi:plasmid stabilization system protein ParE
MAAKRISFHRLAAHEYRSARDWYSQRSVEVAERFRIAVDRAVQRIDAEANALPRLGSAYRFVRVGRYPYVLVFRHVHADEIIVVAVAHTSRRPGYWRRRK